MLRKFYETLKAGSEPFEIVFVSGDKSEAEFRDYFTNEHGDWLALGFGSPEHDELSKRYGVRGIPALIVVDGKGEPVSSDARDQVQGAQGKEAATAVFAQWKKAAGDWRESAGTALGGGGAAAGGDAAAMRAARLAALERRAGGGGALSAPAAPSESAPVASAPAAAPPAVVPEATPGAATMAVAPSASASVMAPPVTPSTAPSLAPAVAPAPAVGDVARQDVLDQLVGMGFPAEQARAALVQTNNDVEQAVAVLTGVVGDPGDVPAPASTSSKGVDPEKLNTLVAMGFPQDKVQAVLAQCDGDIETAILLLTDA